jgi:FdhD protein
VTGVTERVSRLTWVRGALNRESDTLVEEAPVALVYNGLSHVVMMATPADLEDLALGFSLSEGIIACPQQILDCEVGAQAQGLTVEITVTAATFHSLKERRRHLTGRTGCGLCGVESLEQALPRPTRVTGGFVTGHEALQRAVTALGQVQSLKRRTGAVHGAAWCSPGGDIEMMREDVGRHNALDKLLGGLRRAGQTGAGFALISSRASYEMVAKAAKCNIPLLAAVSAPTALAVRYAEACGITLVGFLQRGRHVIYTHERRVAESRA